MREFKALGSGREEKRGWREVIASYRVILYSDGEERVRVNEATGQVEVARRGVSPAEAETVRATSGKLGRAAMLRQRVRHFVDGTAIGTKEFLNEIFAESRARFGPRRHSGARKMRGYDTPLHALRDLHDGTG
jgi:hypothetical protein